MQCDIGFLLTSAVDVDVRSEDLEFIDNLNPAFGSRVIGIEFKSRALDIALFLSISILSPTGAATSETFQKHVLGFANGFAKKSNIIGIIQVGGTEIRANLDSFEV